jgi:site-specific DNA recombinase
MQIGIYARVSTQRQAQEQTIEQQLTRLQGYLQEHGWNMEAHRIYRDEGYSGASLSRPGLDRLRDAAALAELGVVLITAPDRLARKYVHQVLLIEELAQHGCRVEFVDHPMSQDPHDQLLLQIRGAVAEYERTLIAERMRRGRLSRLRAGQMLPWVRVPFGYQTDPQRPRDPAGLRLDPYASTIVKQIFAWYLEEGTTLSAITTRLAEQGVATPTGKAHWERSSVRWILRNPAYIGRAYGNWTRHVPSRGRRSPLRPVGSGQTPVRRPEDEWIPIAVPATIGEEEFSRVQEKLAANQERAPRNNTRHPYLLRALVSCGQCRLSAPARMTWDGYGYYVCNGHHGPDLEERCRSRYIPAAQLDALVWNDLSVLLNHPEQIRTALQRAQGGGWLPQEMQARQATVRNALAHIDRQQQRLLDAYLGGIVELAEFERKRREVDQHRTSLLAQAQLLAATAQQQLDLAAITTSIEQFCAHVQTALAEATFEQKRTLVELLIDRVIVTGEDVEIRYVVPISSDHSPPPFCQLRTNYLPLFPPVAAGWNLATAAHDAARTPPPARGARPAAQCRRYRESVGQDHQRRGDSRLRRR